MRFYFLLLRQIEVTLTSPSCVVSLLRLSLRSMGNLVVTFLWDPIPSRDQQIIEELRLLAKKYSLSEAGFHDREYEEGKTIFGAENAGFWRLVISDDNVDNFSREGAKVMNKYKVGAECWRMTKVFLNV